MVARRERPPVASSIPAAPVMRLDLGVKVTPRARVLRARSPSIETHPKGLPRAPRKWLRAPQTSTSTNSKPYDDEKRKMTKRTRTKKRSQPQHPKQRRTRSPTASRSAPAPSRNIPREHCNDGPYVWDRSTHREGIGSTFNYRKRSLILADAMQAPWIGTLFNSHDPKPKPNNDRWFGLGATDCNETMLHQYKQSHTMNFLQASKLYRSPAFHIDHMCDGIQKRKKLTMHGIDRNTVIEVNEHHLHQDWNYCTFNARFRGRFHDVQVHQYRQNPRPESEFWISVHFRWGDTRTRNVDRPDHRAGRGLSRLAHDTNKYFKANSNARVFFISEGKPHEFEEFRTIVPSTEWRLDDAWKDALWTISQSNIVIGGTSSFFALGAHLCSQCTVVTIKSHPKFRAHRFEKTTHHNLQQLKLR